MSYETFSKDFPKRLVDAADQIKNGGNIPAFAHELPSMDQVIEIFDRTAEIDKLRSLKSIKHDAAPWVGHKSRVEVLAGCERDVRVRYHSRMNAYLGGADLAHMTQFALEQHLNDTKRLISPQ